MTDKPHPPRVEASPEGEGRVHELKTVQPYFGAVDSGVKTFEVRKDDRDPRFEVGDTLRLREWHDERGYSGREVLRRVTYVFRNFGELWPPTAVMAIAPASPSPDPEVEEARRLEVAQAITQLGSLFQSKQGRAIPSKYHAALRTLLSATSERDVLREALPDPAKLELLAEWFDRCHPSPETEVQDELREWAAKARAALSNPTPQEGERASVEFEEGA